jgi:hypothetical protein
MKEVDPESYQKLIERHQENNLKHYRKKMRMTREKESMEGKV